MLGRKPRSSRVGCFDRWGDGVASRCPRLESIRNLSFAFACSRLSLVVVGCAWRTAETHPMSGAHARGHSEF